MNVLRKQEAIVNDISDLKVGDQIKVGKYTATCQKVIDKGAIFMLDQYLDKAYRMNSEPISNDKAFNFKGNIYMLSELRRELLKDFKVDPEFIDILDHIVPFYNGDIVRIPSVDEMFGGDWELMTVRKNRIADRNGDDNEWGWLCNKNSDSFIFFDAVTSCGTAFRDSASNYYGVRPVFIFGR